MSRQAGAPGDGKGLVLVGATKDVVARGFSAADAVQKVSREAGGSGGGKADLAQAGQRSSYVRMAGTESRLPDRQGLFVERPRGLVLGSLGERPGERRHAARGRGRG